MFATFVISFIVLIVEVIYYLVLLVYELITFKTSGYKEKTNVGFLKTYFNKGNYGEFKFYKKLIKIIPKENVYTNIYLDNENTEFTEIDMLAITSNGIYVFEIKNYRGMIYGSENDRNWTQVFNRRSKFQFYNPIRQNYAHIKAVENYLETDSNNIIPMIAFSNNSSFKKLNISTSTHVYHFREIFKKIKTYEKNSNNLLNEDIVLEYKEKISLRTHASEEQKEQHIQNVQEHVEELNN